MPTSGHVFKRYKSQLIEEVSVVCNFILQMERKSQAHLADIKTFFQQPQTKLFSLLL